MPLPALPDPVRDAAAYFGPASFSSSISLRGRVRSAPRDDLLPAMIYDIWGEFKRRHESSELFSGYIGGTPRLFVRNASPELESTVLQEEDLSRPDLEEVPESSDHVDLGGWILLPMVYPNRVERSNGFGEC